MSADIQTPQHPVRVPGELLPSLLRWLPAIVAVLASLPTLWGDFVFDDALILTGERLRAFDLQRIFWDNYWGDLRFDTNYRPLPLLTYALQFQVSDSAFGFHLVNVLLHALVSWLAFGVLRRLLGSERQALLGAVLYAALAIRIEAVAWLVGRAEILAALAVLGGWWLWLAGKAERPAGLLALFAITFLGVCAKENAVVLPALFVATAWARREKLPWKPAVACTLAVGAYAALRAVVLAENFRILDSGRAILVSRVDNPIHHDFVDAGTRIANAVALHGLYLWKTVVPLELSADYSFNQLPVRALGDGGLWLRVAAVLALLLGLVAVSWKRRASAALIGVLLFPLGFAVSGNFLFGIGTIFGERLAYLPSLGFALCLAAWVPSAPGRAGWRAGVPLLIVLLTLLNVGRSAVRAWDWRDPVVLNRATLVSSPDSVRAHLLGASADLEAALTTVDVAEQAEWFASALGSATRAAEILPEYPRGHARMGRVLLERAQRGGGLADYAAADQAYSTAIETMRTSRQSDPEAFFERGRSRLGQVRALAGGGSSRAALAALLEGAYSDFDTYVQAVAARQAGTGTAVGVAAKHFYYRGLVGSMLAELSPPSAGQRVPQANADFERALQLDPNQPDALMQSGLLLSRVGDLDGARQRFERGVEACRNLGMDFHPAGVSAWGFARELVRVETSAGDEAAASRARALAAELRGNRGPRGASAPRD